MTQNSETFTLSVRSASAGPFLKIKLFDAADNLIHTTYNEMDIELSKGLYTLKSEIDGVTGEEKIVKLDDNVNVIIHPPVFYSSALIEGYYTSHEYYTYPCMQESLTIKTKIPVAQHQDEGSLFLFYRFSSLNDLNPNNENFHQRLKLSLLDKQFSEIKIFQPIDAEINPQTGWICFNVLLPSGTYYLKDESDFLNPMISVLRVYKHKQTQFFCLFDISTGLPAHNTARIFVSDHSFRNDTEEVKIIDILYLKLFKQDKHVGDFLIKHDFTQAPWNNPMVMLLSFYLYSIGEKKEHDTKLKELIQLYESTYVGPEMDSDIECIKLNEGIFSLKELSNNIPPPMLHYGIAILAEISTLRPGVISSDNIIHQISRKIQVDSVVTTFKHDQLILLSSKGQTRSTISFSKSKEVPNSPVSLDDDWVKASMIDLIGNNNGINSRMDAARRLGVTDHTVNDALQQIAQMMNHQETEKDLKQFIESNLEKVDYEEFKIKIEKFK